MIGLQRRQYRDPNLLTVVAQVVLDWNKDDFKAFCDSIRQEAFDEFEGVQKSSVQLFQVEFSDAARAPSVVTQPIEGLEITVDLEGSKIIVEPSGYRVQMAGAYKGRKHLYDMSEWVRMRASSSGRGWIASRVSVLYESNLLPPQPEGESYRIEDYVVPRFEFADPTLNNFKSFYHNVFLDISELCPGPYRCRVELSANVKQPGINILIDVLDDNSTELELVPDRLRIVKDLETHVFESVITDRSRKLYGIVS